MKFLNCSDYFAITSTPNSASNSKFFFILFDQLSFAYIFAMAHLFSFKSSRKVRHYGAYERCLLSLSSCGFLYMAVLHVHREEVLCGHLAFGNCLLQFPRLGSSQDFLIANIVALKHAWFSVRPLARLPPCRGQKA